MSRETLKSIKAEELVGLSGRVGAAIALIGGDEKAVSAGCVSHDFLGLQTAEKLILDLA